MKYTHILWDFNGTIINDVETGIISLNTLLARRNMPTIDSIEQYHSVFTFPITKYYENVGFDFSVEPYDKLAIEWVKENEINIRKARLCDGAKEALEFFKNKGVCFILKYYHFTIFTPNKFYNANIISLGVLLWQNSEIFFLSCEKIKALNKQIWQKFFLFLPERFQTMRTIPTIRMLIS